MNTLKYDITVKKASVPTPSGEVMINRIPIIIKSGTPSNNILTSAGHAPIYVMLSSQHVNTTNKAQLKNIAPNMTQEELDSADTIFYAIEDNQFIFGENKKVVTLTPSKPAPAAPPAPGTNCPAPQEQKRELEGKASDAAKEDMPQAPGGPRGMTAGATPQG